MKYLLPCSCGKTIPIEVSQAGQTVRCDCGAPLEAPAMSAIRRLEPAVEGAPEGGAKKGNWSVLQRSLFAAGLAIAACGFLYAGGLQLSRQQLDTDEVDWDTYLEEDLQQLEEMDLEIAWENWKKVRDSGIGPYRPPQFIQHRWVSDWWKDVAVIAAAVGAIGVLLMGIAFFLPRQHNSV